MAKSRKSRREGKPRDDNENDGGASGAPAVPPPPRDEDDGGGAASCPIERTPKDTAALSPERLIASLLDRLRSNDNPKAYTLKTCRLTLRDTRPARPEGWDALYRLTSQRLTAAVERDGANASMLDEWRQWSAWERDNAPDATPEALQAQITRGIELGLTTRGLIAESLPFTADGRCAGWYRKRLEAAGEGATANAIDRDAEERVRARQSAAGAQP